MKLMRWLVDEKKIISLGTVLRFYPPFLFFGIKIKFSKDYKRVDIKVPLRGYFKNNTGVMFGGAMCVASDPFPALLFERLIPNTLAWTKNHKLEYLRPVKSFITLQFEVTDEDFDFISTELQTHGKVEKTFEYYFYDKSGHKVAKVTSTAYLRANRKESDRARAESGNEREKQ